MTNKMDNTERYTDGDWEKLAAALSEGEGEHSEVLKQFNIDDKLHTSEYWNKISGTEERSIIDVDRAWNKVNSRLTETAKDIKQKPARILSLNRKFISIAASVIFVLGVSSLIIIQTDTLGKKIVFATAANEKNLEVNLPDGSKVILNRNTTLAYKKNFGTHGRNVNLSGEAFFEVASDAVNPFTIDAGTAKIKVVGTSFNVITNNSESAVEVFVRTGRVILSDIDGNQNIMLDPGYVGKLDLNSLEKAENTDPNYMAWKTEQLKYDGQTLEIVFKDLKKVFNTDLVADEPSILSETWVSPPIENESPETIIQLICGSFNLSFSKDGDVYHLYKK